MESAVESFGERAFSMACAVGLTDPSAETRLALAKFPLGQLADPHREAERLASSTDGDALGLAELWLVIGGRVQAGKYGAAAYQWVRADGEPYVHRYC